MGGKGSKNLTYNDGFNIDEWHQNKKLGHVRILSNRNNPAYELEEYPVSISGKKEFQKAEDLYQLSQNDPHLVNTKFSRVHEEKQMCSKSYGGKIYTERIPAKLSKLADIPFPDFLHIYSQAFNGYEKLSREVGLFKVEEQSIGINNNNVVKVWHSPNYSQVYPSHHLSSEPEMVKNIVDIIQPNVDYLSLSRQAPKFSQFLYQYNRNPGFGEAKKRLEQYANNYNRGVIPSTLTCILKSGGLNHINQKVQQPITKVQNYKGHHMNQTNQGSYVNQGYHINQGSYVNQGYQTNQRSYVNQGYQGSHIYPSTLGAAPVGISSQINRSAINYNDQSRLRRQADWYNNRSKVDNIVPLKSMSVNHHNTNHTNYHGTELSKSAIYYSNDIRFGRETNPYNSTLNRNQVPIKSMSANHYNNTHQANVRNSQVQNNINYPSTSSRQNISHYYQQATLDQSNQQAYLNPTISHQRPMSKSFIQERPINSEKPQSLQVNNLVNQSNINRNTLEVPQRLQIKPNTSISNQTVIAPQPVAKVEQRNIVKNNAYQHKIVNNQSQFVLKAQAYPSSAIEYSQNVSKIPNIRNTSNIKTQSIQKSATLNPIIQETRSEANSSKLATFSNRKEENSGFKTTFNNFAPSNSVQSLVPIKPSRPVQVQQHPQINRTVHSLSSHKQQSHFIQGNHQNQNFVSVSHNNVSNFQQSQPNLVQVPQPQPILNRQIRSHTLSANRGAVIMNQQNVQKQQNFVNSINAPQKSVINQQQTPIIVGSQLPLQTRNISNQGVNLSQQDKLTNTISNMQDTKQSKKQSISSHINNNNQMFVQGQTSSQVNSQTQIAGFGQNSQNQIQSTFVGQSNQQIPVTGLREDGRVDFRGQQLPSSSPRNAFDSNSNIPKNHEVNSSSISSIGVSGFSRPQKMFSEMPENSINNSTRMFYQNYSNNEYSTEIAPGIQYGGKDSGLSSKKAQSGQTSSAIIDQLKNMNKKIEPIAPIYQQSNYYNSNDNKYSAEYNYTQKNTTNEYNSYSFGQNLQTKNIQDKNQYSTLNQKYSSDQLNSYKYQSDTAKRNFDYNYQPIDSGEKMTSQNDYRISSSEVTSTKLQSNNYASGDYTPTYQYTSQKEYKEYSGDQLTYGYKQKEHDDNVHGYSKKVQTFGDNSIGNEKDTKLFSSKLGLAQVSGELKHSMVENEQYTVDWDPEILADMKGLK